MRTASIALDVTKVQVGKLPLTDKSVCQIMMLPTRQFDALNAPINKDSANYVVRPGHQAIPCTLGPNVQVTEQRGPKMISELNTSHCMLTGYYPNISDLDQAVIDGVTYEIQGSQPDQVHMFTHLMLRILNV